MPKENGIKHNNMNFNVLPPAIDGGNTDDCPENLDNPYILQLIRPLLNRHQRQVVALSLRIEELEMKIAEQKQTITSQAARCHQLDEENRQLREQIFHLKAIQPTLLSVKSSGLEKADATTTRTLNSRLEDIGLPSVTLSRKQATFMLKNGYLSKSDIIGTNAYQTATGDIAIGAVVKLKKIEINGLVLNNVEASIINSDSAPLLLGQSALSRLGKIQIDYQNSTLTIIR